MPNCKSFLVTVVKRKHVSRRERFQQHRDASCHQVLFLQGKAPKETHAIVTEILGKYTPSYSTVKNCVVQFKYGDIFTCDAPCPGRPKTEITPQNIDQINELILEDHRIKAKSVAENLGFSREWVGSIIHEDSTCESSPLRQVGPEMLERGSKTSTMTVVLENFGIFSAGAIQMIFFPDW